MSDVCVDCFVSDRSRKSGRVCKRNNVTHLNGIERITLIKDGIACIVDFRLHRMSICMVDGFISKYARCYYQSSHNQ